MVLQLIPALGNYIGQKREYLDAKKLNIVVTIDNNPEDICTTTPFCQEDFINIPALLPNKSKDTIVCSEPGTYGYPDSSNEFFICHKKGDSDNLEKIELSCPKGMIFDNNIGKCRRRGTLIN